MKKKRKNEIKWIYHWSKKKKEKNAMNLEKDTLLKERKILISCKILSVIIKPRYNEENVDSF